MESLGLDTIRSASHVPSPRLPWVISAPPSATAHDLAGLIAGERDRLGEALTHSGAILFRGFGVTRPEQLCKMVTASGGESMRYLGGDSPRTPLEADVYTSSETPPGVLIPLHHEMSFLRAYPRHLWLSCVTPALEGGETLLADARAIYRDIDAAVRRRFVAHGVRYLCSLRGESVFFDMLDRFQKVTKTWMETFETRDRAVAERRCLELATHMRWSPSGRLLFDILRPATLAHPVTGEQVWFNQAHLFRLSPQYLGHARYWMARLLFLRRNTCSHHAQLGDGSEIDAATIAHLFAVMRAHTVRVTWRRGDVLWVDNLSCMHGRAPYHGPRRVLVAMARGD
jgi:alpha-ketoglutarate-dependent taurine dioxygenase